ncbi:bifunctional ADP-dependent NAD(P)H-hydrate dehydratase/NAD(P)H-hydrate epimerase [Trueperella sp. LYQ143]|uniref:bifunctional ADP-dependent NAD(P)H-hydrate dehydratase/NAD(P)H-hydrate epimerase n=1 Tax=unclassified Trueperella TaxID=2630174 RepID=UPI003983B657
MVANSGGAMDGYRAAEVRRAEEIPLAAGEPLMMYAAHAIAQRVVDYIASIAEEKPDQESKASGFSNSHAARGYATSSVHTEQSVPHAGVTQHERDLPYVKPPADSVLILVGAGNNGGDALYAGALLAQRGYCVTALYGTAIHASAQEYATRCGVRYVDMRQIPAEHTDQTLTELGCSHRVWIDGLLGNGARGPMRDPYAVWVKHLNEIRAERPNCHWVCAIDIPSGVGVDEADIPGVCVSADYTLALGGYKAAHFAAPACVRCGQVELMTLGLERYLPAQPALVSVQLSDLRGLWDLTEHADKYSRGVLGMLTGSSTYPGAAVLGVGGALAMGPGMVRYLGESPLVLGQYPEVVTEPGQVDGWVIGSGLVDMREAERALEQALAADRPVVLDAGAISLAVARAVAVPASDSEYARSVPGTSEAEKYPDAPLVPIPDTPCVLGVASSDSSKVQNSCAQRPTQQHRRLTDRVVLTPHAGELARLLTDLGEPTSRNEVYQHPLRAAQRAASLTGACVVAKGATDIVAHPDGVVCVGVRAPGWRATAGAGDVYAGMVGALLAMYAHREQEIADRGGIAWLAAAASTIHAYAASYASGAREYRGGHPIIASDIIRAIAQIIGRINSDE